MKHIELTRGKQAIVDDVDYKFLMNFSWCAKLRHDGKFEPGSGIRTKKPNKNFYFNMARLLMDFPEGMIVDHINGNPLDNRYCNLRICNKAQNSHNSKMPIINSSGMKGVSYHIHKKKWQAQIKLNHKQIYLGSFKCPLIAKLAYNKGAIKYHGEFANFG